MNNTEFKFILAVNIIAIIALLSADFIKPKKDSEQMQEQATEQTAEPIKDIVSVLPVAEITKTESDIITVKAKAKATPKPTKKPKKTKKKNKKSKVKKDIRTFKVTAYCPCYRCSGGYGRKTATGTQAKEGRTVAVDPKVIPYGTRLKINGREYVAEDCGGAVKGNKIDMFMESHSDCLEWGVKTLEVEVLPNK